jgi:hypothetical protein
MIEKGIHKARAIEWKLGLTGTGGEQVAVLFQLEDGQTVTWRGYFTEKTTERTLDSLEYMGWDGKDITKLTGLDTNDVNLVIDHEVSEKDGKTYPKVNWVNRIGGTLAVKEELTGHALQNFAGRMKAEVLARQQKRPPAQRPQQQRQAPPMREPGDDSYDAIFGDG